MTQRLLVLRMVQSCLLPIAMVLSGCDDPSGPGNELSQARARWAARGPASYTMTIRHTCGECPPDVFGSVIVVVQNRAVTSRHYVASNQPVPAQLERIFPHVDVFFEVIEENLVRRGIEVIVEYDPELGYPVRADFGERIADGTFTYRVTSFQPQ